MKKITLSVLCALSFTTIAQKYTVEKSNVVFFSKASVEDIAAKNSRSTSSFNLATGEITFSIPIHEFQFAKSLMKEHFNEKYMDTGKFPESVFVGKITGYDSKSPGTQKAKAEGKLTIHGITHDVDVPGTIEMNGDKILLKSKFIVKLEDYQVKQPQLLWKTITEQVEVTIDFTYKPQEK